MKRTLLSVKEVAQEFGGDVQSVRHAYQRRDPAYRGSYDRAARDRRQLLAARTADRPRLVKRGRNF